MHDESHDHLQQERDGPALEEYWQIDRHQDAEWVPNIVSNLYTWC